VNGPEGVERTEIQALAATRAELGRDYEPALLDAFADRVEAAIETRMAAAVSARQPDPRLARRLAGQQLALGIVSLAVAIPISIILGLNDQLVALLVCWAGIVAVNWAHALQGRRRVPWYADPDLIRRPGR
jgi:hypothetical protein